MSARVPGATEQHDDHAAVLPASGRVAGGRSSPRRHHPLQGPSPCLNDSCDCGCTQAWSLVLSTCHGTGGVIRKAIDETWGSESARNFSQGSARSISRMSFVVLDESKPGLDE